MRCVCQSAAVGIFGGEDDVCCRQLPVDTQGGVIPGDAAFAVGCVVVVALVLEDGFFAQHGESVGKAAGNEELAVVLGAEFHCYMLTIRGRAFADVYRNIEHSPLHTAHQFALAVRGALVVQPAHYAVAGHGLIILHKGGVAHFFPEFLIRERFKEIPTGITKHAGFNDFDIWNCGGNDIHDLRFWDLGLTNWGFEIYDLGFTK